MWPRPWTAPTTPTHPSSEGVAGVADSTCMSDSAPSDGGASVRGKLHGIQNSWDPDAGAECLARRAAERGGCRCGEGCRMQEYDTLY